MIYKWLANAGTSLLLVCTAGPCTAADVLTSLYSFSDTGAARPEAGVVVGPGGIVYGTTYAGGSAPSGQGTVYQLQPPSEMGGTWTETVLHSFGGPDGALPYSSIAIGSDGTLYGTTYSGGEWNGGTVFQLVPPQALGGEWTETVIHDFSGSPDGGKPAAGVVISPSGILYGITTLGGNAGAGTVFSLHPPTSNGSKWSIKILHGFSNSPDGAEPYGPVTISPNGVLYGTTYYGGAGKRGTVFEVQPPGAEGGEWIETVVHSFNGEDGSTPECRIAVSPSGSLFGTTTGGVYPYSYSNNGTVFQLTPPSAPDQPWSETTLYKFPGNRNIGPEGAGPQSGLVFGKGAVLYGSTGQGGSLGSGTIFELFPPVAPSTAWTEKTIFFFTGNDGAGPVGDLTSYSGALYGATFGGGLYTFGNVFELQP